MPIYEYKCEDCHLVQEIIQDIPLKNIPCDCGYHAKRIFSAFTAIYKGFGFYKTDSRCN